MSVAQQPGRAKRYTLWILAAVVGVVVIVFAWIVFAPGPTDFAGGRPVALAAYQGQDPSGAPPELKGASVVDRG
jgi:hypothetical protein